MSRLWVLPLVLLLAAAGATFALAKWHPAKPGLPKVAAGSVKLGDQYRGETVFSTTCASCHGQNGKGGDEADVLAYVATIVKLQSG